MASKSDDLMLFCRANRQEVLSMHQCLLSYQECSGQMMYKGKSRVFFLKNCPLNIRQAISTELGIPTLSEDVKYLGNPMFIGKNKMASFNEIKEKVLKRMEGWMSRSLSKTGRATRIRSAVQNIPVYSMSSHKLPSSICKAMDSMSAWFWWRGEVENSRCLALKRWDHLCQPKPHGGLGFRRFEDINQALLTKLAWEMARNGEKKWTRTMRTKYYQESSFWSTPHKSKDSAV